MRVPIPTYFIDSSKHSATLMNAKKSSNGYELARNFSFLGRSGVKELTGGLRVAYISGIDYDAISPLIA